MEEEILDLFKFLIRLILRTEVLLGSSYGDGVKITRVEGSGSGSNTLEIDSVTVEVFLKW